MDAPSRKDVERQLRLVLASVEFETSPKLSELLYYLVTETLAGNAERLKGYTIGVDVFDRQPDFDQGVDAIVRVQMGRLRKLLKSYYEASGKTDPIRIHLVSGRYAPRFELATGEELSEETLGPPPGLLPGIAPAPLAVLPPPILHTRRGQAILLMLALLVVATMTGIGIYVADRQNISSLVAAAENISGPQIYVSRYQLIGKDDAERQLAEGLQFDLVNQLSKFPDMAVLAVDTSKEQTGRRGDFLLSGVIESDGTSLRVTTQLRRERDGLVIWSDQWLSENTRSLSMMELQTAIATTVATKLAQAYGVIPQAMFEEIAEGYQADDTEYACILGTYTYMRHKTAGQHGKSRDCLELAIKNSPRHALAWALLSWIYGDEERYGFNKKPGAIGRALRAAERGVAADSQNAVAYELLAHARFLTGTDDVSAREALETSLKLHPNNSEVLADASWILGLMGETGRSRALGLKAIELNPGHPAWYWTRQNISDRGPIDIYLFAAALRLDGQAQKADQELASLAKTHPNIGDRAHMMAILRIPPAVEMLIFGKPR
jgi:adenylate cyclase